MFVKTENTYGGLTRRGMSLMDDLTKIIRMHAETLDDAERMAIGTVSTFPDVLVYRGGSHVAVIVGGERVLMITEAAF